MRIAIPVDEDNGIESLVSWHMGRARYFIVYDTETKEIETIVVRPHEGTVCTPVIVLKENNIDQVFLFEAGMRAIQTIEELNIRAVTGDYKTVREVIEHIEELKELDVSCGH